MASTAGHYASKPNALVQETNQPTADAKKDEPISNRDTIPPAE
jgi:hypothetical protein